VAREFIMVLVTCGATGSGTRFINNDCHHQTQAQRKRRARGITTGVLRSRRRSRRLQSR
jgi:hypothetical protein